VPNKASIIPSQNGWLVARDVSCVEPGRAVSEVAVRNGLSRPVPLTDLLEGVRLH
jgi:hypothetical protein